MAGFFNGFGSNAAHFAETNNCTVDHKEGLTQRRKDAKGVCLQINGCTVVPEEELTRRRGDAEGILKAIGDSFKAVFEERGTEIDKETELNIFRFQIGEDLFEMNR